MPWNWEHPAWPQFNYDSTAIASLEKEFLQGAGGSFAILRHLNEAKQKQFIVEILCTEGLKSSEIEGEILERQSLQSSIQRHFGLAAHAKEMPPKEQGMGELMWKVYSTFEQPLDHQTLHNWHRILMQGQSLISHAGIYRTCEDPMQIIAGRYDRLTIHFEAPPSTIVYKEMTRFIQWFNDSEKTVPPLARAAIAHLYFESIHPFEDGNGRVGRALVEKALSQCLGHPTLIAISQTISKKKKDYYNALGACNRTLDISPWTSYFASTAVAAQEETLAYIHFLIAKSRLLHDLQGHINERQEKVLLRMFKEGPEGFSGGLSAENYVAITKTSKATATRDLADLVKKGALYKTGKLRYTRYWLPLP